MDLLKFDCEIDPETLKFDCEMCVENEIRL